jgi:hypothetical protein
MLGSFDGVTYFAFPQIVPTMFLKIRSRGPKSSAVKKVKDEKDIPEVRKEFPLIAWLE